MSIIAFLLPIIIVGLLPIALVAALIAATALGAERTGLHPGALTARWIGTFVGLATATALTLVGLSSPSLPEPLAYGAVAALSPGIGGAALVLCIALGERTLAAPRTALRSASLVPRTLEMIVPRPVVGIGAAVLAVLALLSILGAALATDGRMYATERELPTGETVRSVFSPFPGIHYTGPLWVGMAILLLCSAGVIGMILRRRPSADEHDILLRRRSSTSVVGSIVLASGLSLLPVAILLMVRLLSDDGLERASGLEQFSIVVGLVAVLVGLAALPVGLVMVVFPESFARRIPARGRSDRPRRAEASGSGAGPGARAGGGSRHLPTDRARS